MRCKRIVGALSLLVASLVAVILFSSLSTGPTRAQQTLAPRSDYVNALWVAGSDGIVKLATVDGTILFEIPEAEDVRTVAVDAQRGILWAYSQGTLYAYSFHGTLLRSVPVFPDDDNDDDDDDDEDDEHIALSVNSDDGTVWLGVHKTVFHFDAQGRFLITIALSDNVQAMALAEPSGHLWVATKKTVSAYDDTGQVMVVLNLGKSPEVKDIDVDAGPGISGLP